MPTSLLPTIGIVANPASGKDIRRLIARASVFDNQEKQAIVRRLLAGALAQQRGITCRIAYLNDAHGIVAGALEAYAWDTRLCTAIDHISEAVAVTRSGKADDTIRAARALAQLPADIVLTLGGDGTNRAFALGWQNAPMIPISTGTNNVFPELIEATIAGAAAGLIASGAVTLAEVAQMQKIIRIEIEGERPDLALIDAVLVDERFIGARALLAPEQLRLALLTRADPAAVGITSIGGLIHPVSGQDDHGLLLRFGDGLSVHAPIAPGYYRRLSVAQHSTVNFSTPIEIQGPGVLAFDGERERVLEPGQRATFTIERNGPQLVDIQATMNLAARRGLFVRKGS
ncbi:MAG: NAD(+)/NADH kinase [Pseudomonadales bacterium]|nr:NAD(+)/NADH kinase [Pseudomonadales bacterium]